MDNDTEAKAPHPMEPEERRPLAELLWQLADDDFVVAQRASEWIGLAPHLEEDIAFASIAQDEMGHAVLYYRLLEDLGYGRRDDLALLRPAAERRNSVLLERPNGRGTYLQDPHFDWAYALVRHFLYDTWERIRLQHLVESAYEPLAEAAAKIRREERYHDAHHRTWIGELAQDGEGREHLVRALAAALPEAGDLTYVERWAEEWERGGLFPRCRDAARQWETEVLAALRAWGLDAPAAGMAYNGRLGQHTQDLAELLAEASSVYRLDPQAAW
jgi:ring-1,2-phenylacetyl-CoA epoxidase subunit PaaC